MQKPNEHEVYRIRMFIRGRDGTGRRDYSNNQNPVAPLLHEKIYMIQCVPLSVIERHDFVPRLAAGRRSA